MTWLGNMGPNRGIQRSHWLGNGKAIPLDSKSFGFGAFSGSHLTCTPEEVALAGAGWDPQRDRTASVLRGLRASQDFSCSFFAKKGLRKKRNKQTNQKKGLRTQGQSWTGMATHSSILAWRIPWTEVPGRLQSTGSQKVRHD